MSAKIFQIPSWDDDNNVPVETFNFKRKANNKKNKKAKPVPQETKEFETFEPGRFVKLHRNVEGNSNRAKKRKFTESVKQGEGVSHAKKKRIRKGNEGKQPMLKVKKGKDIPFTKKTITDLDSDNDTANNKKNKKAKPVPQETKEFETFEPGRFVKLHRNVEGNSNRAKKRKFTESVKQGEGVSHAKKKRIRKGNEGKQPMLKVKKGKDIPFTKKTITDLDSDNDTVNQSNQPENSFQEKLIENLKGSRFRYLNELLYTKPSNEATDVFQDDPTSFKAYHDGYRQQVQQWPLNPLDRMIKAVKRLPKNLVVADFGCGEARLAKSIPQKTYSLDLVAKTDDIIACDMANTPLETGAIDIVIFCLSLMGTNVKDFILEANRVLKDGGLLKIAEVESRFADVRHFVANIKQCGFELIHQDLTNSLFYFMNFKKTKMVKKSNKTIASFSLKPCIYKKR